MVSLGRVGCIAIPWLLTVASFIALVFLELGGWQSGSSTLNSLYFFQADLRNLSLANSGALANTTTLTAALQLAEQDQLLSKVYQIHLWNYCYSNDTSGEIQACSPRTSYYVFDPVQAFGLNGTNATSSTPTNTGYAPASSAVDAAKNSTEQYENKLLGKTGKGALDAYRAVAKWMFIAYEVSLWSTLATIIFAIFAIFSRWGSLITWVFAVASSIITFAAVLTSTILFPTLVAALNTVLNPYSIHLVVGTTALALSWLAVALSFAGTLFWLFSICMCSGRSNPHHRSNKGGLWAAEPKGQGYGGYGDGQGRGRGMRVEKTGGGGGGGYERVGSPFLGHAQDEGGDRVPLQPYPYPAGHQRGQSEAAFEPYRHA